MTQFSTTTSQRSRHGDFEAAKRADDGQTTMASYLFVCIRL